jgi:hypothetical protein
MKVNKEYKHKINMCWQVGDEKKCATLSKEQAYATRDWVEKENGVCFWFQALPD